MNTPLVRIYSILCAVFLLAFPIAFAAGDVILEIQDMTVDKKIVSFELYIDGPDVPESVTLNAAISNGITTENFSQDFNPTQYGVNNVEFTLLYPGDYTFDFELTDGEESDTANASATIVNNAPVLNLIGGKQVLEGGVIDFTMDANDPDDDILTYITNSSFGSLNSATGHFTWNTDYDESGIYFVQFFATDGIESAAEIIMVNVTESGNHAPVLNLIGGKQALEGQMLSFQVTATDPDHDDIFYSTNASSGTLNAHTGHYSWLTGFTDAGIYYVQFSATDGAESSSEIIMVNITESGNHAPVLNPVGNRAVEEGERLEFTVTATDDDSDTVSFSTNATKGSINAQTGVFAFEPGADDSGTYVVAFIASDGTASSSETISIEVINNPQMLSESEIQMQTESFSLGGAGNGRNIPLAQEKKTPVVTSGIVQPKEPQEQILTTPSPKIVQKFEVTPKDKFTLSDLFTGNVLRNVQMIAPSAMEVMTTILVLVIAGSGVYLAIVSLSRKRIGGRSFN